MDEVEPAEQTEETEQVDEVAPEPYVEHVPEPPVEDWAELEPVTEPELEPETEPEVERVDVVDEEPAEVFDWREVVDPAALDDADQEPTRHRDRGRGASPPGAPQPARQHRHRRLPRRPRPQPRRRRRRPGRRDRGDARRAAGRAADEQVDEQPDEQVDEPAEAWDDEPAGPAIPAQPAARSAVPLRGVRRTLRANVRPEAPAAVHGNAALLRDTDGLDRRTSLPEGDELRRGPGDEELESVRPLADDDGRVRPIARLGHPVDPLVIDDFVTEPAYDPVIGPELAAARTRVGLSVDELAERTRIRPHVIESIEVDDFAPCGGDFYARGHLRTLARVLGRDPVPLLSMFDNRYATAPINAKRVFEAELATGMTGSMRSTRGGPNWALLIGVVLALVMTWGVIRLFATQPPEVLQPTTPVLNGSAGVGRRLRAGCRAGAPEPAEGDAGRSAGRLPGGRPRPRRQGGLGG